MTPIDNAVLSELLDNALSDIKYLRQEVASLREAKAEATQIIYELNEDLDCLADAHGHTLDQFDMARAELESNKALRQALSNEAQDRFEENRDLSREIKRLLDEAHWNAATRDQQADRIAELEDKCEVVEARLADCRSTLRQTDREVTDLQDQLALYQDNCECSQ